MTRRIAGRVRSRGDDRQRRIPPRHTGLACLLALLFPALWAPPLSGQQSTSAAGVISGAIVDVGTRAPLAGSLVMLQPEPAGMFPPVGGSPFAATVRAVMTDSAGGYRFAGLPAGRYRLDAVHPGYRPYSVVVELRGSAASALMLGLAVEPIPLEPIRPTARREDPFPRAPALLVGAAADSAPARLQPGAPLSTDAQELTEQDVVDAVTTGEPDLFRALKRLPGMSSLSDLTAELWTRGAPWHETRVFFDGVPLFDPLHGLGAVSGVSPRAVGALWLYPGVHPARLPEGAAGAIELRSRHGAGDGRVNGAADLSLLSAGAALDQRTYDGRVAWMLSARRSSLDWLSRVVGDAANRPDLRVPYDFSDVVGRLDVRLPHGRALEVSALREADHWQGDAGDGLTAGDAEWGNVAARVSFVSSSDRRELRQTLAFSSRTGRVRTSPLVSSQATQGFLPDAAPRTSSDLQYLALTGEWRTMPGRAIAWDAGYELSVQGSGYFGEKTVYLESPANNHTGTGADTGLPWVPDSMNLVGSPLHMLGAWLEGTFAPAARLTVQPALRLEAGDAVLGGGRVRPAPRLMLRYEASPRLALSAAVARTWQYSQSLGPTGVRKATLSSDDAWLLAASNRPALHADVVTAGAEGWAGDWRLTANAYARREDGVALPDPTPGLAFAPRPQFVVGRRYARGVELSARRIGPSWSVQGGYSLARATMDAADRIFPSGTDRRHVLDVTGMLRAADPLRLGAALTAASGSPYTPIVQEVIGTDTVPRLGEPNSRRGEAYVGLDLLLDWSGKIGGREVGAYLQLENALGRANGVTYIETHPGCIVGWCGPRALMDNGYERGLPRLPVLGVRARF